MDVRGNVGREKHHRALGKPGAVPTVEQAESAATSDRSNNYANSTLAEGG